MLREKANKVFKSKGIYIAFSIIAAILLWLYVTNVENKELDITISNIPVNYIGLDELLMTRNLYVDTSAEQTVTLTIRGKRNIVNKLNKTNIDINVELSDIRNSGTVERLFSVIFPSSIDTSSLYIIGQSPRYISIDVEKYISKEIDIDAVFNGDVAEGFMAQPVQTQPSKIMIRGPENTVSQVAYAQVVLDMKNISKTITAKTGFTLMDSSGNTLTTDKISTDIDAVNVTLPVTMVKDVELSVNIVAGGGADASNTAIKISPSKITLTGDSETLEKLDKIILDTYNLKNITAGMTKIYMITIPEGLTNLSGESMANVTLQLSGLVSKNIKVTNFTFVNVKSGYKAASVTQSLDVTVRGVEEIVSLINADNVVMTVDFKDLGQTTGTYAVAATGTVRGYMGVGVVGDYTVVVTLSASTG